MTFSARSPRPTGLLAVTIALSLAAATALPAQAGDGETAFIAKEAPASQQPSDGSEPANVALPPPPVIPTDFTAVYKFTALGLKLGEARLEVKVERNSRYQVHSRMKTGGLAAIFFQSRYVVVGLGRIEDTGAILPSRYDSRFVGSDSAKLVSLIYGRDGLPMPAAADPPYGERILKQPVTVEQKRGTVDPMGAWVHFMTGVSVSDTDPCGTVIPVFDGRRRYDFRLEYKGQENVKVRGGDVYKGKAYRCAFVYTPVAGYKAEQLEKDAVPVPPLEAWVIPLKTPQGRTLLVPSRVEAKAPIGKLKLKLLRVGFAPVEDEVLFAQSGSADPSP
ncbi:MAG: DUF3108 domain-containing protein [Alphaproteobacteria bacterium]